jgi:hypothetical protein
MRAKKTADLHIRLTPEDKMKLDELANKKQTSISSLILKFINNEYNQGTTNPTINRPSKRNEGSKNKNRVRKTKRAKQIVER